ncbi:MAG: sulfite exporter TauE/SafE family protein [Candidatus Aminicenantes bacterium]|nr:sulfite exporter TauE/SafE family protein [Candidatus Aminicenantes bacterium]
MEYWNLLLLFGMGIIVGFINVNAGGGSSLTLPMLIFLGLDGALANGTNRVAIFVQNVFAVASFRKREFHEFKLSGKLSLLTLPGAIIGSILATKISGVLFERMLGVVLLFIVLSMFFSRNYSKDNRDQEKHSNWLIYPTLFGIGFYGGFLQVGVGFLFMAALYNLLKLDLIRVNMHKVFIVLIYTIPALLIFIVSGNINWKFGLTLAAGSGLGAWFGARASVKGGEKLIRIVLAIAIFGMALKLLI